MEAWGFEKPSLKVRALADLPVQCSQHLGPWGGHPEREEGPKAREADVRRGRRARALQLGSEGGGEPPNIQVPTLSRSPLSCFTTRP